MSRKPLVVRNAVRAPLRSIKAFVKRVVPWIADSTWGASATDTSSRQPCRTARAGSCGVVRVLWVRMAPDCSSISTKSVNVPPMSKPNRSERLSFIHPSSFCPCVPIQSRWRRRAPDRMYHSDPRADHCLRDRLRYIPGNTAGLAGLPNGEPEQTLPINHANHRPHHP